MKFYNSLCLYDDMDFWGCWLEIFCNEKQARRKSARLETCLFLRVGSSIDTGKCHPFLLRLDDAGGSAIDVEKIVGKTVALFQSKVPDCDSPMGQDVCVALIVHCPAGLGEEAVDVFSGLVFGGGHGLETSPRKTVKCSELYGFGRLVTRDGF